jgi:hypothetical protein
MPHTQVTVDGTVVYSGRTGGIVHGSVESFGGAESGAIFYVIEPNALPAGPHTMKMIEYEGSKVECTATGDVTITG